MTADRYTQASGGTGNTGWQRDASRGHHGNLRHETIRSRPPLIMKRTLGRRERESERDWKLPWSGGHAMPTLLFPALSFFSSPFLSSLPLRHHHYTHHYNYPGKPLPGIMLDDRNFCTTLKECSCFQELDPSPRPALINIHTLYSWEVHMLILVPMNIYGNIPHDYS